jgi:F-type H+-transporting ATPase subunit b
VNRAREALRARVSELAVQGAEQILEKSVDREAHQEMLNKLAAEL